MDLNTISHIMQNHTPGIIGARHTYSVLVPLVEREGKLHLLYEVRSETLRRQPGEICFPGGRLEEGESPAECALRETEEELGIPRSEIRMLGQLDHMHHQGVSMMYAFVGVLSQRAYESIRCSRDEVDSVFLVPLDFFVQNPPYVYEYKLIPEIGDDFPYEKLHLKEKYAFSPGRSQVPIYEYEGRVIWGITGRLTRSFLQLMGVPQ